ncbi:DUF4363 family protein [Vallitalea maricola]|uniref:Uncharacterized protein n=1 Tax=Vallitalea maricola TaxID=3074433 RepID=A0ACB5UJ11_9FIRM|nr:hypothetical protein AN2V17_11330 [Vallitalea sp. AN17-2]
MKKMIIITFTCIILGIFILIMNSGGFLKKPFGEDDDVETLLKNLNEDIVNSDWEKGLEDMEKLKDAWDMVDNRVQFSVERDDLMGIELSIARLMGSIRGENKDQSLIGFEELKLYWNNLEK